MSKKVYKSGALFFRALVKDADGVALTPADVSAIRLSVFEKLPPQTAVEAYTDYEIPTSALLSTPAEDSDGNLYNFEYCAFDGVNPLFPKRLTSYVVELVLCDASGKPSAHQLEVDAF